VYKINKNNMAHKEDFPSDVDVVVLGTGVTEAMVAASCARIGKSVLHLDRNTYYGSQWATFSFAALQDFFDKYNDMNVDSKNTNEVSKNTSKDSNNICFPLVDQCIQNVVVKCYVPEKSPVNEEKNDEISQLATTLQVVCDTNNHIQNKEKNESNIVGEENIEANEKDNPDDNNTEKSQIQRLDKEPKIKTPTLISQAKINDPTNNDISIEDFHILNRKFNLDISPKFLFSAGPLVKTIIKANITHYAEFKVVDRILMWRDNFIVEVPCNRSDVFTSSFLSMIEKRTLMKFLTFCLENEEMEESDQRKPFKEFLTSKRLSENLQSFIIYSIAMVKPDDETEIAMAQTRSFLSSLGHYGKTPFLWALFGTGEIPQMFCRMSAVFAGLYCLDKVPVHMVLSEAEVVETETGKRVCKNVLIDKHEVHCKYLVADPTYIPSCFIKFNESQRVSKAILVVSHSLAYSSSEHLSFLTIPPLEGKKESVRVIEVGPSSSACPTGLYIVYLSSPAVEHAYTDLSEYVSLIVYSTGDTESKKPKLYWSVYFNQYSEFEVAESIPDNIFVGELPGDSLGYKHAVLRAEEIFLSMYPSEEFLMKVPNSEDIVWDYDDNNDTASDENINDKTATSTNISSNTTASSNITNETSSNSSESCNSTSEKSNHITIENVDVQTEDTNTSIENVITEEEQSIEKSKENDSV